MRKAGHLGKMDGSVARCEQESNHDAVTLGERKTMESTASLTARVTGARAFSEAMTWGQVSIWQWHGVASESEEFYFNSVEWEPMPETCPTSTLTGAIARVLSRHDGLRTVYEQAGDGWRQVVEGEGDVRIEVYEAGDGDPDELAGQVAADLCARPWTVRQWPLRFALVVSRDLPVHLVVASNRLALDPDSMNSAAQEVLEICAGKDDEPPPAWQVLDETRFEQSPQGQATTDRALQHWRQVLTVAPTSMFDFPASEPGELRFHRLMLESPAMARAVRTMQLRSRTSASALLIAAITMVLGRYTGHDEVVLQLISRNRVDRRLRELVGTVSGQGIYYLGLSGEPFSRFSRDAFRACGSSYRFGYCDPAATGALVEQLSLSRGAYLDLGLYVNDLIYARDDDTEPSATPQELRELARDTVIADFGGSPHRAVKLDIKLHLTIQHAQNIPLLAAVDTSYVPAEAARELLGGIERILVAAASGEDDFTALSEISEVTPVRRPAGWARCGNGWVDLAASQELLRQASGTGEATVSVQETPGGGERLVGCLAGQAQPDFTLLHRRLVAALAERSDVRAPDWYRWLGPLPGPADPRARAQGPAAAEGDGRPDAGGDLAAR
jgi:hypothetical protein